MEIVLVRHGETEWSRDMRHTGRTDIPLTERGREEARVLRDALREWSFARVMVEPAEPGRRNLRAGRPGRGAEICRGPARVGLRRVRGHHDRGRSALGGPAGICGATAARAARPRLTWAPAWIRWSTSCEERGGGRGAVRARPPAASADAPAGSACLPRTARLFALSTATLSVLGFERETAVIRRWNAPVALRPPPPLPAGVRPRLQERAEQGRGAG